MRDVEIAATSGFTPTAFDGKPLPKGWPLPIHDAAFHGVAGDVVRAMSPHTEADEGALLVQLLVAFGNLVGRGAYWEAGADHHHGNLFTVVVGNTSTGRKGSGWSMISNLLHPVDPCWRDEHVKSGVSSGEGLIFAVRDPIMRRNQIGEKGRVVGSEEYVEDPGVADKRLLAQEGEFANVLKVATREGNTISTWLRQAWDGTDLGTLTKAPITATRPHISMIGHITAEELRIALTHTDTLSGFANRFLWVASTRSKSLPSGGNWATGQHRAPGEATESRGRLREGGSTDKARCRSRSCLVRSALRQTHRRPWWLVRCSHRSSRGTDNAVGDGLCTARPIPRDQDRTSSRRCSSLGILRSDCAMAVRIVHRQPRRRHDQRRSRKSRVRTQPHRDPGLILPAHLRRPP